MDGLGVTRVLSGKEVVQKGLQDHRARAEDCAARPKAHCWANCAGRALHCAESSLHELAWYIHNQPFLTK